MFTWFKNIFRKKSQEIVVNFTLPNGNLLQVTAISIPCPVSSSCKIHLNYLGVTPPEVNCNSCWDFYARKIKHK